MKKKLIISSILFAAVGSFLALNFTACLQNDPTIGYVKVIDSNAVPKSGIMVKVYCTEPLCLIKDSGLTDNSGRIKFEYDLPAVLKIDASKDYTFNYKNIIVFDTNNNPDTVPDTTITVPFTGTDYL
ncbi:MAG: hypothetical protein ACE5DN_03330, partial [Flavobacteriales bacterium]